jgi:hypothetical protein
MLPALQQAFESGAPPATLQRLGIGKMSADQLDNIGVNISTFRDYNRSIAEVQKIFPTFDDLKNAGFTRYHLDSTSWTLGMLANAYQRNGIELAHELGCTARDLIRAKVPYTRLSDFGIRSKDFLDDECPFELFFVTKMNPGQLKEHFGFTGQLLFKENRAPVVNIGQLNILYKFCGWNRDELKGIGCTDKDIIELCGEDEVTQQSKHYSRKFNKR